MSSKGQNYPVFQGTLFLTDGNVNLRLDCPRKMGILNIIYLTMY